MSGRSQCVVGFLAGASVDLAFYAGAIAVITAAAVATAAAIWWRAR